MVGFEFGNKMAVPVISGVVIAKENEEAVRDAHRVWTEEQRIKEEGKIEKQALDMWRKMLMGLRIRERVADEYGSFDVLGDEVPNARKAMKEGKTAAEAIDVDDDECGGFEPEDEGMGGGFILPHEDEEHDAELIMEHHEPAQAKRKGKEMEEAQYPTPNSMPPTKGKSRPRKSILQYDGPDGSNGDQSSELSEAFSSKSAGDRESEDDDGESDDFEASMPSGKGKGKLAATQKNTTPKRTRRSLRGQSETSPYF